MARTRRLIIGGVDTHASTHHAVVIDLRGRLVDDAEFAASPDGYAQMLSWMRARGQLQSVGIEGTGAYGAGLARHLHEHGVEVLEVPRPDRRLRRQRGTSDPLDAEAAARTVLAGNANGAPKLATGPIEAIRMLRVARTGAVKARTAVANTLLAVLVTAPEPLRSQLRQLSTAKLIAACLRYGLTPRTCTTRSREAVAALDRHPSQGPRRRSPRIEEATRRPHRRRCSLDQRDLRPRTRHRLRAARRHRRQSRPAALRGSIRTPVRRCTHPRLLGNDQPTPSAPRRRPLRQPRPAHRRRRPTALRPAQPRLRRPPNSAGHVHA
jgi:transposase